MRIKIKKVYKKNLNERFKTTPKMSTPYILDNVINPSSRNSIFNKKLIFYDLETNGFMPDAYVHQIAALEFDIGSILRRYLAGEDIASEINNLSPSGGIIIKSKFDFADFKEKDAEVREKRKVLYNSYCRNPKGKDPVAFAMLRNLFVKTYKNKETKKTFTSPSYELNPKTYEPEAIKGAFLCIKDNIRIYNSQKLNDLLTLLEEDGVDIDVVTKDLIEKCLNEKVDNDSKTYEIKSPEAFLESSSDEERKKFFVDLYNLFYRLSESPYRYGSRRGKKRKNISTNFARTLHSFLLPNGGKMSLQKALDFTYAENKTFTAYDNFPIPEYEGFLAHDKNAPPTEAEGIKLFLEYLKSLGANKYILVGHNIKSFDNNVILGRASIHNISKKLVDYFQNSEALDTLEFLQLFTKQMQFFNDILPSVQDSENISGETKATMAKSQAAGNEIIKMHGDIKTKLDGIMKIYDSTKEFDQTHTADDDCEKLAKVFLESIMEMYEMDKAFRELAQKIDLNDASANIKSDFSTFQPQKMTSGDVRKTVLTKVRGDLQHLGMPNPEEASLVMNEPDQEKAVEKAISRFTLELVYDIKNNKPEVKTSEDAMSYISNLSRSGARGIEGLFTKWMELKMSEAQPATIDPQLKQVNPEDIDTTSLRESILKRWSKMIK